MLSPIFLLARVILNLSVARVVFFFHCLCTNKKYYRAQIVCDSSGCMFKRVAQMLNSIFLHYPILVSIELICIVNIYRWLFVLAAPDWSHSQESPGHKLPHNFTHLFKFQLNSKFCPWSLVLSSYPQEQGVRDWYI